MKYRLLINVTEDAFGRKPWRMSDEKPVEPTDEFVHTWTGEVAEQPTLFHAAEKVFHDMNVDSRPTGQICPSMSVGDVVVFETAEGEKALACAGMGFQETPVPTKVLNTTWLALMDERDRKAGRI